MTKFKKVTALALVGLVTVASFGSIASAAPVGGAKFDGKCVLPGGSVTYTENFWGGSAFNVSVDGNERTLLSVYVYGVNGVLITSSTGYNPSVSVIPHFTQQMTIVIVNHGAAYNCYNIYVA